MSMAELIEKNVKTYLQGAIENDPQAQRSLHVWLCLALSHLKETGEITDFVFNEIHNQHMGIANGETAAEATRTAKPHNAPRQAIRADGIYETVKFMLAGRKNKRPSTAEDILRGQRSKAMAKQNPNITYIAPDAKQEEVFNAVAKIYPDGTSTLTGSSVKRIYFEEKKKRGE